MSGPAAAAERRFVLADLLPASAALDVALVVGGALLTAVCAQVVIPLQPFSPVPITGQTFAVLLVAASLGPARGSASLALYVLAGLALPVYAEGASGPQVILGATGGYLVAFPVAAAVVGALAARGWDRTPWGTAAAFLAGSAVIYAVGVPWLAAVAGFGPTEALARGMLPFVPGDVLKALLAAGLLPAAWKVAGSGRQP